MTAASWSPTDLNRQRLVVRGIALRTLEDRRRLHRARRDFAARLHDWVRSPVLLAGCFAAGWLVALAVDGSRSKRTRRRPNRPGLRQRLGTISASLLWLMQQYDQGARLAARLATLRAPKQPPYTAEPAVASPPIGT